ncbi:hypothetical protein [Mesorhizobium sp. Pch-S]|uniref:hypothetical protein n=1 Tax=Mesorhizobium sp. Pch-S TaxID=2082387 RepID=UPI0010124B0A|nr:hypothetical protein [Mesorhizobium sp. Pch-S]QAZ46124.1 hypothetical protein C1M53_27560 [Mesorhizobium sp. Pch-S]
MARPKLGDSESIRLQMVITKDEIGAIDDWQFRHRVPNRSEAIRRLCQIAMRYEDQEKELMSALRKVAEAMKSTTAAWKERNKSGDQTDEVEFLKDEYRKLYRRTNILMHRAQVARLETWALARGGDLKEAMRLADEKRSELEGMISGMEEKDQ